MFKSEILWLEKFGKKFGLFQELFSLIGENFSWEDLGRIKDNLPKDFLDKLAQEIIKSENGRVCYCYCKYIENREDVVQALIKSGDGYSCCCYCRDIENREDVRKFARGFDDQLLRY